MALSACATQTPLPELPAETPGAWHGGARSSGAGQLQPDLSQWWRAFDDPVLDGLIQSALNDNLSVAVAGLRLRAARHMQHHARTDFWPNLNFRIYEETAPGASTGYFEMGFDAQWEFGFFGRALASSRMATADVNTAIIDEAAARVSVSSEVAKNYIELRAAQKRAQIAGDLVALRKRRLGLMQVRMRTHLASQIELDRAQVELQQAMSEAGEPELNVRQSSAALAVLLGKSEPDAAWSVAAAQPVLPALDVTQAPANLVRTRPEIRRAEQNVLHAAGELGIARADLYPKLGLVGSLISATALTGDLDHPNRAVPLLGPTVQLPLWDWGARRDVVAVREAALQASVLAYREAVLEGIAEVETALANLADKSLREKSVDLSLAAMDRSAGSARTMRQLGLADGLDESLAELAAAEVHLQHANVQRERALAFIALYKAFGGALPPLEPAPE